MHTDLRRTGWFSCSDERLDRFHEAAVWSFRDNACDIPTDCPHRERHGWTGDWQLFVPTAAFLYDVAGFSTKWLRDVAADQWPDGTIANISPSPRQRGPREPDRLPQRLGRLGRRGGDRAVGAVPRLRRRAGPRRAVADDGRAGSTAPSGWPATQRHPDRAARSARAGAARAVPLGHRLPLGRVAGARARTIGDFGAFVAADKGDVATAYFAYSARLMARIADGARPGRTTPPGTPS